MGCSPLKSKSLKTNTKNFKLNPRVISTMSRVSTINLIDYQSRTSRIQAKKCKNFKIFEKTPKFALNTLDLSKTQLSSHSAELIPIYTKIKSLYSAFSSAYSNFSCVVHECCMVKSKFSDVLTVFMLSVLNNDNIRIQISQRSPLLRIDGELNTKTLKVFEAWQELELSMELVIACNSAKFKEHIKYMQSVQKTFEEYSEFVLKPSRYIKIAKLLKSAVETFGKISVQTEKMLKDSTEFFSKFKGSEKKLKKLLGRSVFSCKEIVHSMN